MTSHLLNTPCKRGHVGKRNPKSGKCSECVKIRTREKYLANIEEKRAVSNAWYWANKEKALASSRKWRENNPEKSRQAMITWQTLHKERMNQTAKVYRTTNRKQHCSHQSQRRAAQLQRTPKWVDLEVIKNFYEACPPGHHVDHIVPLKGKIVSGLHVPWNLQYLSALDNIRKGNKFEQGLF